MQLSSQWFNAKQLFYFWIILLPAISNITYFSWLSLLLCHTHLLFFDFCLYYFQVMKTCKRLGIKTVAVYSEADANAVSLRIQCPVTEFWKNEQHVTCYLVCPDQVLFQKISILPPQRFYLGLNPPPPNTGNSSFGTIFYLKMLGFKAPLPL